MKNALDVVILQRVKMKMDCPFVSTVRMERKKVSLS